MCLNQKKEVTFLVPVKVSKHATSIVCTGKYRAWNYYVQYFQNIFFQFFSNRPPPFSVIYKVSIYLWSNYKGTLFITYNHYEKNIFSTAIDRSPDCMCRT